MIHDYKYVRYDRDPESPMGAAVAGLTMIAIFLVLLFAPTWGAWIDGVCK